MASGTETIPETTLHGIETMKEYKISRFSGSNDGVNFLTSIHSKGSHKLELTCEGWLLTEITPAFLYPLKIPAPV